MSDVGALAARSPRGLVGGSGGAQLAFQVQAGSRAEQTVQSGQSAVASGWMDGGMDGWWGAAMAAWLPGCLAGWLVGDGRRCFGGCFLLAPDAPSPRRATPANAPRDLSDRCETSRGWMRSGGVVKGSHF
jgi:hypothetical protein